jgi:hypothetical protein|nr:MAG TPA: LAGLIDADG DNA endonuclease family [Caudoviricetes sp.]
MINGQSAEKNYAYLLGLYFGDGHIEKRSDNNYIFTLQAIDKDFVEYTAKILSIVTQRDVKVTEIKRKTSANNIVYSCTVGNIYFKDIYEDTYCKQVVPPYVFEWEKECQLAFLEGIMDSDGYMSARTNGSNWNFECGYRTTFAWALSIKKVFSLVGIETKKIIEIPQKAPKKDIYGFRINLKSLAQSDFKFNLQRKQNRFSHFKQLRMRDNSQRLYARTE